MDENQQVGDEVLLAVERLVPASKVKEYLNNGFCVYFDFCDPAWASPPGMVLVRECRQKLENDYDRWVDGVTEA